MKHLFNKTLNRAFSTMVTTLCLMVTSCGNSNNNSADNNQSSSNSPSSSSGPSYSIKRPDYTPEYNNYELSGSPSGVNMTYYSDIYSRGFAWLTDITATETELYLVQSDQGADADFSVAEYVEGTAIEITYSTSGKVSAKNNEFPSKTGSSNSSELVCLNHRVHVENLEKGKAYSYKLGSGNVENGYTYGAFIVENDEPKNITAIELSDAQTLDPSKLNVWRNTFVNACETAGANLDMVLYNGDQFDQNMTAPSEQSKKPIRSLRYAKALDVIQDYKASVPYMTSSGNHEPSSPYSHYIFNEVDYGAYDYSGGYYSYDYGFAHFVVLNTNDVSTEQINWLKEDLDTASEAKWKVVMTHISPYTTGDHSNKTQDIVEKLTPVFSAKHVDLVLEAHDHTYSKTKAYRWDNEKGYTQTSGDNTVVNLEPETEIIEDREYDKNPNGTYYIITGAAGHRCGEAEEDGIWAEVVKDGDTYKGLDPNNTFLNNKYKTELGTLKYSSSYTPYTFGSYTSNQQYQKGDLATGNVNAQMFGVLNMTENTLSYDVYTVNDSTVRLFDSLDVLKN